MTRRPADGSPEGTRTQRTPAKVNLGLRVTGRREDGYHLLESVFAPIDLYDEVRVDWDSGPDGIELEQVVAPAPEIPDALRQVASGPDNLVYRAARAFLEATGLRGSIRLSLKKQIPAGAGLGGGSSDAAAVLRSLSAIAGPAAPDSAQLAEIALRLGADVPFFLSPAPSLVSGIGEKIEPLEGLPALNLVLANPGISVATAEVYRVTDALADSLTGPEPGSTMRAILRLRSEKGNGGPALGDLLVNDLMPAATRICPPIARLMEGLTGVGSVAQSMSGSGGTVFGVFPSAEQAERAARELKASPGCENSWVRRARILVKTEATVS